MEAQLAKTIMSLQQVTEATVHITPSNDSPFLTDKEDAKASVLLKLRGSRILPDENTQAIVNLVAASHWLTPSCRSRATRVRSAS